MKQELMRSVSSLVYSHSRLLATTAVVALISAGLFALQLPSLRVHAEKQQGKIVKEKTWRLFIVPTSVEITHANLQAALESEFGINPAKSKLSLTREHKPKRYCATLSLRGAESPFTSYKKFTLDIGQSKEHENKVTVTPDDEFLHMTTLYDGTEGNDNAVDLIVVPGLASHPYGSFKAPKDSTDNWLRDYLPTELGNLRILVYGYESSLVGRKNKESIMEYGEQLLRAIYVYRQRPETWQRPIVFLGHSLGGLIIKQALVAASTKRNERDTLFLKSCYGFLFFGVPNRGLRHEELVEILGHRAVGRLVSDLVVDEDSEPTDLLKSLWGNYAALVPSDKHRIIAFYETVQSPTVEERDGEWVRSNKTKLMVTQDSATLIDGYHRPRDTVSLTANHSTLVKYDGQHDRNYIDVLSRITEVVEDAVREVRITFSSKNELAKEQKTKLQELKQALDPSTSTRDNIPDAYEKTLEWFLAEPPFEKWHNSDQPSPFWICGPPGQGKSVLAKFLTTQFEKHQVRCLQSTSVISFFCNAQENFQEPINILHQLILQLVDCKEDYESMSEKLWDEFLNTPFDRLWELFEDLMLRDYRERVYCVIDALDECPEGQAQPQIYFSAELPRSKLLRKLVELSSQSKGRLRLLITSRSDKDDIVSHLADYKYDLTPRREDLEIFTQLKLQGLTKFSDELKMMVREKFRVRTERSFLWHSIVMKELHSLLVLTPHEVERILNDIPPDIDEMYLNLIKRLAEQHLKILIWVAYATRPLTVDEIEDALAFDHLTEEKRRLSETKRHRSNLGKSLFTETLGSFLSVQCWNGIYNPRFSSVFFQHQSAKDFFDQKRDSSILLGVQPDVYLARTCLYYLTSEEFRGDGFQYQAIVYRIAKIENHDKPYQNAFEHHQVSERLGLPNSMYDEWPFTFLQYAGANWFKHIKSKKQAEAEENNPMIEKILDPSHPFLLVWLSANFLSRETSERGLYVELHNWYYEAARYTNPNSLTLIAIRFKIDWLVEKLIEVEPPSKSFGEHQLLNMVGAFPKAFELCIKREKQLLLNLSSGFLAKLFDKRCPFATIKALTDLPNIEPKIIEEALGAMLKGSNTYGLEAVKLLLVKAPGIAIGTDTYIQRAIKGGNKDVLEFILNTTPSIAESAGRFIQCAIQHGNKDIFGFLLSNSTITDNHILDAIEVTDSDGVVDLLLKEASGITITNRHVQHAIRYGKARIIEFFLSKNPKIVLNLDHCIRDAIKTRKAFALRALLNRISNIAITDSHIYLAIETENKDALKILLGKTPIGAATDSYIRYAIQIKSLGVIKFLLTVISNAEITLDHIQCAIQTENKWILKFIFSEVLKSTITDDHLRYAVQTGIESFLRQLLERRRDNIAILDELVDIALNLPGQKESDNMIKVLLDTCHTETTITETHLLNAAQRGRLMIVRHFLRKGDQHKEAVTLFVTKKVVTAILNSSSLRHINQHDLLVILVQLRTQIHPVISENTAGLTVRGLHYWSESVVSEILKMRAPNFPIGEGLVTAAASNESIGGFILDFFLRQDLSAEFTDKAMCALMRNKPQRQLALKVLLNSHASRMKFTDTAMLETLIEWPDSFPDFINQLGITFETATRYWRITNRALRQTPLVQEDVGVYLDYSSSNQDKLWMAHRCCCERMKILSANLDQGDQPAGQPITSLIGPHEDNVLESLSDEPQFEPDFWAHAYYTAYSIA